MFNIGPQELLLLLVIALVVIGPQRLPSLGRSIGRALRELRKAQDDVKRTIKVNLDDETPNGSSAGREATTTSDPAPNAREPLPPGQIEEVSRTLGRGLQELRKARREVERSFRVDLTEPAASPPPAEEAPDRPGAPEPPAGS